MSETFPFNLPPINSNDDEKPISISHDSEKAERENDYNEADISNIGRDFNMQDIFSPLKKYIDEHEHDENAEAQANVKKYKQMIEELF